MARCRKTLDSCASPPITCLTHLPPLIGCTRQHVEAGRNNLLVTICLMAYYVETYRKGYLDSTDLDGLLGLLRVLGPRT